MVKEIKFNILGNIQFLAPQKTQSIDKSSNYYERKGKIAT